MGKGYAEGPAAEERYEAAMLAHLRLTGLKLGLIVNFGERSLRNAVRRVANTA